VTPVFTDYVKAAMKKAKYELMENGAFWGEIPGFQGVWGSADDLELCRQDLQGALEGWLILKLWLNDDDIPVLGRLNLAPKGLRPKKKHESAPLQRSRKAS
jgi:predicted RNase H-like HicB family nuclease